MEKSNSNTVVEARLFSFY